MRIAVLTARSLQGSGYATRLQSMIRSYATLGHEVDLLHYRLPHERKLSDDERSGLTRYATISIGFGRLRRHVAVSPPLAWQCLRAHRMGADNSRVYDVVQAETANTWSVARMIHADRRVAVLHDDDAARLKGLAKIAPDLPHRISHTLSAYKQHRWQKTVLEEADRVWFASRIDRDRLAPSVPRADVRVIPNGADDRLWSVPLVTGRSKQEVLFVGPGSYEANVDGLRWFLRGSWTLIRQLASEARLRVVGPDWGQFPASEGVSFRGWRQSLTDQYEAARVVIAPLFAGGGTKLKVLEAMAAARPVVTTPVGAEGIPSSDGVQVCAEAGAFAAAVRAFLTDPTAAARAGELNRTAVEGLRWSSIWERAIRDLEDLVSQGARR